MGPDRIHLLLDDLGWLRTLARRLARDPDVADDLVQEACAIALRQAQPPNRWRAWLTTVVQNLFLARQRGDRRRHQLLPLIEADVGVDEQSALQRAADQQRLAATVMQLDEPYRSTVLLRFFDGLPPRRIAREQGVPVATVHSRLQRAMQQLRGRLDREYGSRANWLVAFAAVGWPIGVAAATRRAGVALLAGTCLLLLAVSAWWLSPTSAAPAAIGAALPSPTPAPTVAAAAVMREPGDGREPPPSIASGEVDAAPAVGSVRVRGRVVDCDGAPVGSVPISVVAGDSPQSARPETQMRAFATSDAAGCFVGELPWAHAFLMADRPDLECVWISNWSRQSPVEPILVVAPGLQVAGVVVTAAGERVTSGRVWLELPDDLPARVGARLDRAWDSAWNVPIDAEGRFRFRQLPAVRGASLRFSALRVGGVVEAPLASTEQLQLELPAEQVAVGGPSGVVLLADGAPAANARLCMGRQVVYADRDGRFAFPVTAAPDRLVAALPKVGWGELMADDVAAGIAGGAPLVVALTSSPGVASGRIVDGAGQPIPGAEVWLAEPTPFGRDGHVAVHLEYFLAGGLDGGVGLENLRDASEAAPPGGSSWLHLDHPTSLWYFAVADADGRFELPGLLTHSYQLIAFDRSTGCFGALPGVRAGSTAEVVVRRNEVWPELSGRLVSRTGEPIVGARVQQKLVPFQCGVERPQGRFHWCLLRDGRRAESDADGRFVLRQVGRRGTYLIVEGDEILPLRIEPEELLQKPGAPIAVSYRCPVEVMLADAAEADACACEGADGICVSLLQLHQNSSGFAYTLPLHGGRSGVFCVGDDAVQLRLLRRGVSVRLIPIAPRRGQVLLVQ